MIVFPVLKLLIKFVPKKLEDPTIKILLEALPSNWFIFFYFGYRFSI